jgi:FtsP/CotA-like multicopper oxidase with cupredoxin domain
MRKLLLSGVAAAVGLATLVPRTTHAQAACAVFDKNNPTVCLCPLPGQTGDCANASNTRPLAPLLPSTQPMFAYDLPVPINYVPDQTKIPGVDYYEIQMSPVTQIPVAFPQAKDPNQPAGTQWLGLVDPVSRKPLYTEVWGYSQVNQPAYPIQGKSTYPSMSFRGVKNRPVKVKWINNAPDNHLFCKDPLNANAPCGIDRTLMGTLLAAGEPVKQYGSRMQPDNAMVVHLHGGEIPPDADGFAELWIGNPVTAAAYADSLGAYYTPAYPLLDSARQPVPGVASNVEPPFIPPPGSGIAPDASYAGLNVDPVGALITNAYQPGQLIRPLGNSVHYNYPMVSGSAQSTIWYHDHALGKTRVNVMAGPAGFFFVDDPNQVAALVAQGRLPNPGDCSNAGILAGKCYDIPIAFQDRSFNADGSINFPNGLGQSPVAASVVNGNALTPGVNPDVHPQWVPEYFGDHAVVNGVIWPRLKVEPRPYRFRFLDGSNARCYTFGLKVTNSFAQPSFTHVATEQGLMPAPVTTQRFSLCPGERADVVIDFRPFAGKSVYVTNTAGAPFPAGPTPQTVGGGSEYMGQLMRFDVVKPLNSAVPATWSPGPLEALPPLATPAQVAKTRQLILNEVLDPVSLAPVRVQIDGKSFEAPATETPKRGTTERWVIINTTVDAHPMHLHLVQFRVVSRQKFDTQGFMAAVGLPGNPQAGLPLTPVDVGPYLLGAPRGPDAWENGWKDTAKSFPGEVLVIEATWDGRWRDAAPAPGTPWLDPVTGRQITDLNGNPVAPPYFEAVTSGPYVWHCHIVDHEDNEMMRPTLVMP